MSLDRSVTRRSLFAAGAAGLAGSVLAACSGGSSPRAGGSPSGLLTPTATPTTPPPDPASIRANELGLVPVLMHHRVVDNVQSEFDMTPAYYRAELERLYAEGYYPVRTIDLVHGTFDHVPPGKTPVVMTFDDGSPGQFGYTSSGAIKPTSGVGILVDFHREHPDFPAVASVYINQQPFGIADTAKALGDLHGLGFEIGNHTMHHLDLKPLDAAHVQSEFGQLQAMVGQAVPGLRTRTMALPLGVEPRDHALAHTGRYAGQRYINEGVLLVGAEPFALAVPQAVRRAGDPAHPQQLVPGRQGGLPRDVLARLPQGEPGEALPRGRQPREDHLPAVVRRRAQPAAARPRCHLLSNDVVPRTSSEAGSTSNRRSPPSATTSLPTGTNR